MNYPLSDPIDCNALIYQIKDAKAFLGVKTIMIFKFKNVWF